LGVAVTVCELPASDMRANGVFTQQGPKLVGTGAFAPAYQGQSVALSAYGSTAIVGGPDDDPFGNGRTRVRPSRAAAIKDGRR
jgi:hypothetical protein